MTDTYEQEFKNRGTFPENRCFHVKEEGLDDLPCKRTREGHRQPDKHWNCFRGKVRETSERRGGANMGFSECMYTNLN